MRAGQRQRRSGHAGSLEKSTEVDIAGRVDRDTSTRGRGSRATKTLRPRRRTAAVEFDREGIFRADLGQRWSCESARFKIAAEVSVTGTVERETASGNTRPTTAETLRPRRSAAAVEF